MTVPEGNTLVAIAKCKTEMTVPKGNILLIVLKGNTLW